MGLTPFFREGSWEKTRSLLSLLFSCQRSDRSQISETGFCAQLSNEKKRGSIRKIVPLIVCLVTGYITISHRDFVGLFHDRSTTRKNPSKQRAVSGGVSTFQTQYLGQFFQALHMGVRASPQIRVMPFGWILSRKMLVYHKRSSETQTLQMKSSSSTH